MGLIVPFGSMVPVELLVPMGQSKPLILMELMDMSELLIPMEPLVSGLNPYRTESLPITTSSDSIPFPD